MTEHASSLLTLGHAAMLSAGVLTLLAVRRRQQLRRARPRETVDPPAPRPAATERALRSTDTGERLERLTGAIDAAAPGLVTAGQRLVAALLSPDGAVELIASGAISLTAPWQALGSDRWAISAATPIELIATSPRPVTPCPALVQLGRHVDGRDVYVDLEALEALEVGGPADDAQAIVAAIAMTLAGSVAAEVTTLVGLGIADEAFLGHRLHRPVRDAQRAFAEAADAIGATAAATRSTFDLRANASGGEAWEPAVVLIGAAAGPISPPPKRTGLAVVSASPITGPSSRLAPEGAAWRLLPLDITLTPVGLRPAEVGAVAELVRMPAAEPATELPSDQPPDVAPPDVAPPDDAPVDVVSAADDPDVTILGAADRQPAGPAWSLLVRMLGGVDVVDRDGRAVDFERSKTRELVAWLATHRTRSTRSAARTALWELDVRDATFNNVVSEARRALARLVEPPDGAEWVGRTMTDALPLHDLVRTDAELLGAALDVSRLAAPDEAIAALTPAVELIRGLPFEGTSYLWPDSEGLTSELVLLATTAAAELAAHCLSVGDTEGVFDATGRGLQVLPGHEELIGLRMRAHARVGDHAGVRHEWESYERVIVADPWSDGEPSPKLVELRRNLLSPSS